METLKIAITQGDPNGVGPEVIVAALAEPEMLGMMTPVVYGNRAVLAKAAEALGQELPPLNVIDTADDAEPGCINLIETELPAGFSHTPGQPSEQAGAAARAALTAATEALREGEVDAMVTAPIDKKTVRGEGFSYCGHTEYLQAALAPEGDNQPRRALMILCNESMRVAVATGHLALRDVPDVITVPLIVQRLRELDASLRLDFAVDAPRIAVLGLNPHGGDNGVLGTEEEEIIGPAVHEARVQGGIMAFGPYAPDGFFGSGAWRKFDAVLAMYHDQGLIPFKLAGMDTGVNFSAGLTAVRTSPDHGTGYDIAGRGVADPSSMRHALFTAIDITRNRRREAEATANPLQKQSAERPQRKEKDKDAKGAPGPKKDRQHGRGAQPSAETAPESPAEAPQAEAEAAE